MRRARSRPQKEMRRRGRSRAAAGFRTRERSPGLPIAPVDAHRDKLVDRDPGVALLRTSSAPRRPVRRESAAPAEQARENRGKSGDQNPLPQKVKERPSERGKEQSGEKRGWFHRFFPSISSRSLRIRSSSSAVVGRDASTRITRRDAEPPKARSTRSPTICCSVRSRGRRGA